MAQTPTPSRLDFGSAGSWNAIEARAREFVDKWRDAVDERANSQEFWIDFLMVFGIDRKRAGVYFEYPQLKLNDKQGFVDLFWPGKLVAEQKSRGKNLTVAMGQALDYLPRMLDKDLPRGVIVSDFATFRLRRLDNPDASTSFTLDEFPDKVRIFAFLIDMVDQDDSAQNPVNVRAAQDISNLHEELKRLGYRGMDLEIFLTRVVFCLFAEDTGIFNKGDFARYVRNETADHGRDLGRVLNELFEILDKAPEDRQPNTPDVLKAFPYVNGGLFAKRIDTPMLDTATRRAILTATQQEWSQVNPSIFGSMFQGIMDDVQRRNLGAHYTSEKNILRLIQPLFLDDLYAEFNAAIGNKGRLQRFHDKIATLRFLDPACGSGNFLVITYRELRRLEHKVIAEELKGQQMLPMDIAHLIRVTPDQMAGIEIEEFPAQVAQLALWLTDHQMNIEAARQFGGSIDLYARIPIRSQPNIVNANALTTDWGDVVELSDLDFIFGNPPFSGKKYQTKQQKADMQEVLGSIPKYRSLDFVVCWFIRASEYMQGRRIRTAFVATNSISQGEQVAILWKPLFERFGVTIDFAHRAFKWRNEASGVAGVDCVIVGFSTRGSSGKRIFEYPEPTGDPVDHPAARINGYLTDAPDTWIHSRSKPISNAPKMWAGNKPVDYNNLKIEADDYPEFIAKDPLAQKYIKKMIGAAEFINNRPRYCLWLVDCPPDELRKMPEVMKRVDATRKARLQSVDSGARNLANTPTLFRETMNPSSYLVLPAVSSERREYIPMAFYDGDTIPVMVTLFIPFATNYHFGILTSKMHMSWMRTVAGRLESRFRYSKDIVYNNFPWPENVTDAQQAHIEFLAQAVLDARAAHPTSTLADLYDPLAMPADLRQAHTHLDRAVDRLYRSKPFADDAERVAMLLKIYQRLTATP